MKFMTVCFSFLFFLLLKLKTVEILNSISLVIIDPNKIQNVRTDTEMRQWILTILCLKWYLHQIDSNAVHELKEEMFSQNNKLPKTHKIYVKHLKKRKKKKREKTAAAFCYTDKSNNKLGWISPNRYIPIFHNRSYVTTSPR